MVTTPSPFASLLSFLDPQKTEDGSPYGPARYKEIVKERWYISKHLHTSYVDVGKITPLERLYLLQFIKESSDAERDYIENLSNTDRR